MFWLLCFSVKLCVCLHMNQWCMFVCLKTHELVFVLCVCIVCLVADTCNRSWSQLDGISIPLDYRVQMQGCDPMSVLQVAPLHHYIKLSSFMSTCASLKSIYIIKLPACALLFSPPGRITSTASCWAVIGPRACQSVYSCSCVMIVLSKHSPPLAASFTCACESLISCLAFLSPSGVILLCDVLLKCLHNQQSCAATQKYNSALVCVCVLKEGTIKCNCNE